MVTQPNTVFDPVGLVQDSGRQKAKSWFGYSILIAVSSSDKKKLGTELTAFLGLNFKRFRIHKHFTSCDKIINLKTLAGGPSSLLQLVNFWV